MFQECDVALSTNVDNAELIPSGVLMRIASKEMDDAAGSRSKVRCATTSGMANGAGRRSGILQVSDEIDG